MSTKFSPTAVWRMRASPGPGLPTATSSQTKTSGPPVLRTRMACVMECFLQVRWMTERYCGGSGLDDDVAVLDMHREGLGDVRPLGEAVLEFFCDFLAPLDRDRIGTDLEAFRVEPGLAVAHVEFPAVPGATEQLADARALVDPRLGRGQTRHARRLFERRAGMRTAIEQREELAIDVEHDDVPARDAETLFPGRRG